MAELLVLDTDILNSDCLFENYYNSLSDVRRSKVDSLVFKKDKNISLGAGILLDNYLCTKGLREKTVNYSFNQYGKPSIKELPGLYFSLSHSGHYAIAAFSDNEIGCDIEEFIKTDEKTKLMCLAPTECEKFTKDDLGFIRLWSRKESYLKAKGLGLNADLKNITDDLIKKEFTVFEFDSIKNYSLVICHNDQAVDVRFVTLNNPTFCHGVSATTTL